MLVVFAAMFLVFLLGDLLVAVEVIHVANVVVFVRMLVPFRKMAVITVVRVVVVVNMAVEMFGAMEPRAGADKNSAAEPLGTVIAIRGALIGGIIEIAVRTDGCYSDADADLCLGLGSGCREEETGNSSYSKKFQRCFKSMHLFTSFRLEASGFGWVVQRKQRGDRTIAAFARYLI